MRYEAPTTQNLIIHYPKDLRRIGAQKNGSPTDFRFFLSILRRIHSLSGKGDTALLGIYVLDSDLDDVTGLEELGGVLDVSVGHLGDVEQTVVVHADVNEATEVDNVSDGTLELHTGLQVGNLKNVGGEDGCRSIVTDIAAGLLELGDYIKEGGLTAAELTGELCGAVLLCLKAKESKLSCSDVLGGEAEAVEQLVCHGVGLGVNAGVIENFLTAGDTEEACALGEGLIANLGYLLKCCKGAELTVFLSVY